KSEKIPANIITTMITKLAAPSGCWRENSSTTLDGRADSAGSGSVGASIAMALAVSDARVEHRVEQGDHEIDPDVDGGEQHPHALDQREIVMRHALHEQLADAVEIEHLLGHDQPADQEGEFDADDRDRRQQRVAQRVA